jgi:protein involved in polysaccharide export with SLBB domain
MPSKPYVIGPEDVLEIRLANHPQLNGTVTVRPDGKITFPRAGDVWASGRTTMALAAQLKTLLERTLNNVRVEVEVKTARARVARVMGAVRNPGTYDIKPSWRIVDLVAAGGGLSTKATRVSGRIVRGATIIPLDVPRAMAEPDSIANFPLLPNDLLVLDESSVPYQVTVSGKVTRPGAYELEDQLSLTKLLAKAGGVTEGAALKKAQILRGGVPIELDISESELQNPNSPAARFTLQVGDVLVVPENQARYGLLGQVARPAYYPLPENGENATLLKLLANAGGALPDADLHNATVTRTVDGKAQVATVDLSAMLEGQLPDNQTLLAGDVLFVPRKTAQVHVIGQVAKPGAYALDDRLTIPSLIAEAGNMVPGAALTKVYVLRDGARMPLNLSSVFLSGTPDPQTDNFRFQSGDVLVVPENQVRYAVMGQVARPGNYNYPDKPSDATVLKALAEAGGPLQGGGGGANLKQSSIVRTVNGQATAIPIDISALLQKGGVGNDTLLQPGDILYVPPKGAPKAALGGMLSFLGPLSLLLR